MTPDQALDALVADSQEMENVELFPNWKERATPAERFQELALMARKHPEDFDRFVVVISSAEAEGSKSYRVFPFNCNDRAVRVGLLQIGVCKEFARE